jgi:hypothetical protein
MDFYIPRSLYRLMSARLLVQTLAALGRQGPACRCWMECLESRRESGLSALFTPQAA